ncbi:hypothetical protein ABPG74_006031 [Tetrahymena malaccensis]
MSLHEKMQTDYLWVKDHSQADSWAKARTHGYNYIAHTVPNKKERYEMIWRSMGKSTDWELEKFRLGKKFPDRGNKRRWFKNLFRLIKNPLGYIFWKTYKARLAKPSLIVTSMFIGFTLGFIKLKAQSIAYSKKQYATLRAGKNIEGSGQVHFGYHDQKWGMPAIPMFQLMYYELPGNSIVVNPCRNQNYRLYFEMRKKLGILPA